MTQATEARVGRLLEVQQRLDTAREQLADALRGERDAFWAKSATVCKRRRETVLEAGKGGQHFWLTAMRNCPELWGAITDRDELALRLVFHAYL